VSEYLVEVKHSARKSNAAVGSVVCQHGVSHRFASRDEAEAWAADLAAADAHVWIRAANPDDRSDVDAYLVGWLHRPATPLERTSSDDDSDAAAWADEVEQAWLADYARTAVASNEEEAEETTSTTRRGGERITDWLASQ